MAKQTYEELINSVIELLGGKSNISFFAHCVTRLRFTVKDKSLVQDEVIEKKPGVMGCQWMKNQMQIIIGPNVNAVFDKIVEKYDLGEISEKKVIEDKEDEEHTKKKTIGGFIEFLTGCLMPLIPILIAGGMVKTLLVILIQIGVLTDSNSTYIVLNFAADSAFYFLPIFTAYTTAKKINANIPLAMLVSAMLLHPTFTDLINSGTPGNVFGLPIHVSYYSSSIFPAFLATLIIPYVEKLFKKVIPDVVKTLFVPMLTLIVMVPILLVVIGPLGIMLGTGLSAIIVWFNNTTGFLGVALLSAMLPLVIMTGMHLGFVAYDIQAYTSLGYEKIVDPSSYIANFTSGATCIAVAIKSKNKNEKSIGISAAISAMVAGISEPALFGVVLKNRKALISTMIGGFAGGAYYGLTKVACYTMPALTGIFGIPAFVYTDPANLRNGIIGIAIGAVVSFVIMMIIYKPEEN